MLSRYARKLSDVLDVEEVGRLLAAEPGIKYRAALGVAYGAGLRVSEVSHLKVEGQRVSKPHLVIGDMATGCCAIPSTRRSIGISGR